MSVKKTALLKLGGVGPVLATREKGRDVADQVALALADSGLVISFTGVEVATPSFLDEIVVRLAGLLRSNEDRIVVIADMNDDVSESLRLVLDNRGLVLATLANDQVELLGGPVQLKKTLSAATRLKRFDAAALARELKVKVPNLHQRLKALMEAGAVTRRPDEASSRRRFEFEVPDASELDPKKLRSIEDKPRKRTPAGVR
jgi:hypothetical protein